MKVNPVAILAGMLAAVLSVGLATSSAPRPQLETGVWSITDMDGKAISPERPLDLPIRFADFDLRCRIELPRDADLDLVFRKVEHWGDLHLPIFHTRFAAIRATSRKGRSGSGWLTREELLLDPGRGGIEVEAGAPGVSLELRCRGNRVTEAVVNGIELPPFETRDDFGNLALICREGTAVVHDFTVTPWPAATDWTPWIVSVAAGAVLGLLLGVFGASVLQMAAALAVASAGGFLAARCVFDHLLPVVDASSTALAFGAPCLLPMAVILGIQKLKPVLRLTLALVVGGAAGLLLLELVARAEEPRLAAFDDRRMDLVFGPESGSAAFDAATRMLKCEYAGHTLQEERYDVLLLGGKEMFDAAEPSTNVGTALETGLRAKLRLPVDQKVRCAAIPTELPNAYQQVQMYSLFYKDYRPKVVVLGLSSFDDDADAILGGGPRELAAAAGGPREKSGSILLDLFRHGRGRASKPDAAKSGAVADLQATLADLLALCTAEKSRLVLVVDKSLSKDMQKVALGFAGVKKVPLVSGFSFAEGVFPVGPLVEAVVPELIR